MKEDAPPSIPKLAPPGAGLPKFELFVARLLFGWKRRRTTREMASAAFAGQRAAIGKLARSCDAETGARRVLIDRLRGLEDSSRFWSVFMTLDHLRIVNDGCTATIRLLALEKVPQRVASTADVKPSAAAGPEALAAFERSCDDFTICVAAVKNLKTTARFTHPWFGPLDAAGWHFIGGWHMGLHRRQLEHILAGVRAGAA